MREYFLSTQRLSFAIWAPEDLTLANGLWGDPEVTRYHGGAWSPTQIQDRLNLEMANFRDFGRQYWPLFLNESGEHVGCCGFRPYDAAATEWELGCHLRRAFWSKKLGREAARAVISYGFDVLGIDTVRAGHHPENEASRRFLQSLGFRYTHDELYPPTRMIEPCYSLSRPDFRSS